VPACRHHRDTELPPNSPRKKKKPGIREVAALAGVGMTSVSRVLANHPDVSETMRVRVMDAVERLGYIPNMQAKSLRGGGTFLVGCLLGDISNPLMSDIVRGAEETLSSFGYSLLLTDSQSDADRDAYLLRVLEQRQVDGLIVSTASESHRRTLDALADFPCPIAAVDRDFATRPEIGYVLSDHRSGMSAAVEHLLKLGHRRIDFVVGPDIRPSRERFEALRGAYAAHGLRETFTVHAGPMSAEFGYEATQRILGGPSRPTAIILGANQFLDGCLGAVRQRGLRVGADFSLVTCDDLPLARHYEPPVSVVKRDTRALGQTAASLVLEQIRDGGGPRTITLPTVYEDRGSVAAPRA